jgi:hypothetical protein
MLLGCGKLVKTIRHSGLPTPGLFLGFVDPSPKNFSEFELAENATFQDSLDGSAFVDE